MVVDFQFLNPSALWLLPTILLLGLGLQRSLKKRREKIKLLELDPSSIFPKQFPFIAQLIFVSLLSIALARPSAGYIEHKLAISSSDYVFILDISDSMLSNDVKPSRLAQAQRKIADALEILKLKKPGARVSLVLFAGAAYVFCPPTEDFTAFKIFLDAVQVDLIDSPGSQLLGALKLTDNILSATGQPSADIIVLSDFEEQQPDDSALVAHQKKFDHRVNLIGFGTPAGGPIRFNNGRYLRDKQGNFVTTRLDTERLKNLGDSLSGWHGASDISNNDITQIIAASATSGPESSRTVRIYNELGPWLVIAAFLALIFACFLKVPVILFALIVIFSQFGQQTLYADDQAKSSAPLFESLERQAVQAYQQAEYEKAKALYSQALETSPENRKLIAGLAASEHQLGNSDAAQSLFTQLLDSASSARERFEALYNLGTSALKASKLDAAIDSLEQALKIKPGDHPTETNLEVAKKLKEQQEQTKQEQKKDQQKQDNQQDKEQNQDQQKDQESQSQQKSENQQSEQDQSKDDSEQNPDQPSENQEDQKPSEQQKQDAQQDSSDQKSNDQQEQNENTDQNEQENNQDRQGQENDSKNDSKSEETNQQNNEQADGTEQKDGSNEEQGKSAAADGAEEKEQAGTLNKQQARAWLESLPDAPVILRRNPDNKRHPAGEQTW